ncbi:MAG: glycosyltransferase family 4 protein [Gaiellaceae bacterium]
MRVMHVHRIRGIGGSERHLLELLPALTDLGVEPVLVGLDDPAWDPSDFYGALRVPSIRIPSPRDVDPLLLGRLTRRLRADIVHTHLVHADLYGGLAAKLRRERLVSTKHNDDPFRTGPFRHVERALCRAADSIVAITESLRRFTVEQVGVPAEKVTVVHYGLDDPPAAWGENPPDPVPGDARVLLAIARLVPQKGLDVAVQALAAVRERHPAAVLVVLGEGPERPRLAGEGVYLLGRVPDVAAWLGRAELLVHPARWEGFGLALLEAMLAGLPVVGTRVSSVPEIVVDGETGLLVPPDDPAALAAAILRVLEDPATLGAAGLARARAEFSVEQMARRTLDVYEALPPRASL